eukprot:evm.model.NODE_4761_length_2396_cov_25.589315.2
MELGPGVADAVGGGKVPLEQVEESLVVGMKHTGVTDVQATGGLQASGRLNAFLLAARGRGGRRGFEVGIKVDCLNHKGISSVGSLEG